MIARDDTSRALSLSTRDVTILKGAGILLIFLHNYFHWQPGLGIENEFTFEAANFTKYLDHAFSGPLDFFRYSIAYFGHFGVQLFVLTSGYGLYLSAQRKPEPESYWAFLIPKVIKVFALLVLGALIISLVQYLRHGEPYGPVVMASIVFFRITSIWNFSFDSIFKFSGPFWFFGLIVQLYIVFPLLRRMVANWTLRSDLLFLLAISLLNVVLYPLLRQYNVPLMGQFIGQLPVFMLGIVFAKHGYRSSLPAIAAALLFFALGQFHQVFFTTTFLAVAYLMIAAFFGLKRIKGISATRIPWLLEALGAISMAVFIINGPLRTVAIFQDQGGSLITERIFLFSAILILTSFPVAFLFKKLSALLIGLYTKATKLWAKRLGAAR